MNIFERFQNIKAQHTIEYTVLLTLIMAAIIIIGPYVVRSWNANLKSWDDSVMDSIQDPLLEVPPSSAPVTGCNADPEEEQGCNLGTFDSCTSTPISCGPLEMLYTTDYSPANCRCAIIPPPVLGRCEADGRCCTYESTGCVGCPPEQGSYTKTCGDGSVSTVCGYNDPIGGFIPGAQDPLCTLSCKTPPQKITNTVGYGDLCTGDESGLTDNTTHYSYIIDGGETVCTAKKCEIHCADPYEPAPDGESCVPCQVPWVFNPTSGTCGCYSAYNSSAVAAGGTMTYSSIIYPEPVNFLVDVWTEDLNYCVNFYDQFNNLLASFVLVYHAGTRFEVRCDCNSGCRDDDPVINHSGWISYKANRVWLRVREGGGVSSANMGYDVRCTRD